MALPIRIFAEIVSFNGSSGATDGKFRLDASGLVLELQDDSKVDEVGNLQVELHLDFDATWNDIQDAVTVALIASLEVGGRTCGPHDVLLNLLGRG